MVMTIDIKPENILLNEHGDVKLVDFGLSNYVKIIGDDGKETRPAGAPVDQAITDILKTQCGSPHVCQIVILSSSLPLWYHT
jgi:serine/threonine protein kinase